MEIVGEKTENIQRKRTRRTSSSLPQDVTSQILSKLPAKSVLRFRCISKLWSSITTDAYFINSYKTHASTRPSLLLFYREGEELMVFSVPQKNPKRNKSFSYSTSQPIHTYRMTYPKYQCSFAIKTESVHGLICFQKLATPILWNPTMRKFLPLPKPEATWRDITVFLGYDPVEDKHKVMCLEYKRNYMGTCDECRVLTLGSAQEKWRTVKTNHSHDPCNYSDRTGVCGRCINGVIYYQARMGHADYVVMSFDVRSEVFAVITYPPSSLANMVLISYEGKLAFVNQTISMLILEDAEKHEWSEQKFPGVSHYDDEGLRNSFKLVGSTSDGELFFARNPSTRSFDIIFIHPRRESFRRVAYRGIVDEHIRGSTRPRFLHFFPSHIENLISL